MCVAGGIVASSATLASAGALGAAVAWASLGEIDIVAHGRGGLLARALAADPAGYHLRLPKFFVQYKTERFHGIAGTFRIGFGQRLVLDNTARYAATRVPYADTINVSMNQVLMRSLNTSLAAVLPVLSLLVVAVMMTPALVSMVAERRGKVSGILPEDRHVFDTIREL